MSLFKDTNAGNVVPKTANATIGNDETYVAVDTTTSPLTMTVASNRIDNPITNRLIIFDPTGNAATNPITVVGEGGEAINGQPSFVMDEDFMSIEIINFNSTMQINTGQSADEGVTDLVVKPDLGDMVEQNNTQGNVNLEFVTDKVVGCNFRDLGNISNIDIKSIAGIPVGFLGSPQWQLILEAFSTATQTFIATDEVQLVEFGAAQPVPQYPISLAVGGTVTITEAGTYLVKRNVNIERALSGAAINFRFRTITNGNDDGPTTGVKITDDNNEKPDLDLFLITLSELDDASTWVDNSGDLGLDVTDLVVDDSAVIYAITTAVSPAFQVVRSINAGVNYTDYSAGLPAGATVMQAIAIDSRESLYVATNDSGVYFNNTGTWVSYNVGIAAFDCRSLLVDEGSGFVYVGTALSGVWRRPINDDPTVAWEDVSTGLPGASTYTAIIKSTSGVFYVSSDTGVYVSDSPWTGWALSLTATGTQTYLTLTHDEKGIVYAGGIDTNAVSLLFRINFNDAPIWTSVVGLPVGGLGEGVLSAQAIPFTNTVYVGTNDDAPGPATFSWVSYESGSNFQLVNYGGGAIEGSFFSGDTLYSAGLSSSIYTLAIGQEPYLFSIEMFLDSANLGANDGILSPITVTQPLSPINPNVWKNIHSSDLSVWRLLPFSEASGIEGGGGGGGGGGGDDPGGPNNSIQVNVDDTFNGYSELLWDPALNRLTRNGSIVEVHKVLTSGTTLYNLESSVSVIAVDNTTTDTQISIPSNEAVVGRRITVFDASGILGSSGRSIRILGQVTNQTFDGNFNITMNVDTDACTFVCDKADGGFFSPAQWTLTTKVPFNAKTVGATNSLLVIGPNRNVQSGFIAPGPKFVTSVGGSPNTPSTIRLLEGNFTSIQSYKNVPLFFTQADAQIEHDIFTDDFVTFTYRGNSGTSTYMFSYVINTSIALVQHYTHFDSKPTVQRYEYSAPTSASPGPTFYLSNTITVEIGSTPWTQDKMGFVRSTIMITAAGEFRQYELTAQGMPLVSTTTNARMQCNVRRVA